MSKDCFVCVFHKTVITGTCWAVCSFIESLHISFKHCFTNSEINVAVGGAQHSTCEDHRGIFTVYVDKQCLLMYTVVKQIFILSALHVVTGIYFILYLLSNYKTNVKKY